jgi:hypothetical protein
VRGLAAGEKGYESYAKLFKQSFVFLNEYTTSVQAEHDPRGPEGPYRFTDRSVPVLVIKRWDGETIVQQLGFIADPAQARRSLAQIVDRAVKKHGPVIPPKALRPLIKSLEKGEAALNKRRTSEAIREFSRVVDKGSDTGKFPEPPSMVATAQAHLDALRAEAEKAVAEAEAIAEENPKAARRQLVRTLREYGEFRDLKAKINERLKELK